MDTKIQNMIREASDDVSAGQGSPSDALGRTIPRESDKDLLRDFENRRQRGEL